MQDHTAKRPPLPSDGPLIHRDKCARFPGSHRRAKRGSSYVRYMGSRLHKERPSVRLDGRGSDLCMGSRWTAREVAIGAAVGCFVIAGLSVDLPLALLFGAAGAALYIYVKFAARSSI